jgi:uncharacterized protein YlxP (DUF503 family)
VIVGTLKIRLVLRESHSLKDKRRVLKSLKDTLSNKFNISVAETDEQDVWQTAEIGVAAVGTDTPFVQSVLTNVVNYVRFFGGVELVDSEQEIYGDEMGTRLPQGPVGERDRRRRARSFFGSGPPARGSDGSPARSSPDDYRYAKIFSHHVPAKQKKTVMGAEDPQVHVQKLGSVSR